MFQNYLRLAFFLIFFNGFTQEKPQLLNLQERIELNKKNFKTQPEKSLAEIDGLIKESQKLNDKESELKLLEYRYKYYYFFKVDFDKMIESAQSLKLKANQYQKILYEAKSHKHLAQAYSFNELYDNSLRELRLGLDILEKTNEEDDEIIIEKANFYTAFANIYNFKKEYYNGLRSLHHSMEEHGKLKDNELRRQHQFMDYANLGAAYFQVDLDSAELYTQKSIALITKKESDHNQTFLNYLIIGKVHLKRGNYKTALSYFKNAEKIDQNKHFINVEELYRNIAKAYEYLDKKDSASFYNEKLLNFKVKVLESQNETLRKQNKEMERSDHTSKTKEIEIKSSFLWIFTFLIISILIGFFYIINLRKKRGLKSENNILHTLKSDSYLKLLELLKENKQAFLIAFEEEFPEFQHSLSNKYPKLSHTDFEFLMMIKLNLSTKEIAKFTHLELKTVQNRRYSVRKKMGLSPEKDLFEAVNELN